MSWFSASEYASLGDFSKSMFNTTITIQNRDAWDSSDSNDPNGDDDLTFTNQVPDVLGWIYQSPAEKMDLVSGQMVVVYGLEGRFPAGTNVNVGDRLIANGETYIVTNTSVENTWTTYLKCSLRKMEG